MKTVALSVLMLVSTAVCQSIEDGWKGIFPLRTNRSEVEKILGKPKVDENGYYRYKTNEGFVRINFSTDPCVECAYGRGNYDVTRDTVLDYYVVLEKSEVFSKLELDKTKYFRDTSGHVRDNVLYAKRDGSLIISVDIQDGIEYVGNFYYYPRKNDAERYQCKQIKKVNVAVQSIEDGLKGG